MSGVESLRVIGRIVDHTHSSDVVDNLAGMSVIQIVTAIVTTVTETENSKVNKRSCYIHNTSHDVSILKY